MNIGVPCLLIVEKPSDFLSLLPGDDMHMSQRAASVLVSTEPIEQARLPEQGVLKASEEAGMSYRVAADVLFAISPCQDF